MRKAVIYARFSSDKQTEDSIEAQKRACLEYAQNRDIIVIRTYADEAISGKTAQRKEYQRLLRDLDKKEFDLILIHKYDRVARNLAEHVTLEQRLKKYGVELVAVAQDFGNTNEAKIIRALTWSMSEYYLDNLSQEVKKGHRETALKGLHNGGYPPFGYDVVNQKYVINPVEAVFVRKIFSAALQRKGFSEAIKEMAEAGIKGKRGKQIRYPQIYEMLRNEKYTGVYLYSQTEANDRAERREKKDAIRINNAIPKIIDEDVFKAVNKIMDGRKQTGRKGNYLCSGLVYCECGAKMHAMTSKRKGHEYQYYYCSKKCGRPVIKAEDVDKAAVSYLEMILNEDNQKIISDAMRKYQNDTGNEMKELKSSIEKKIREKQKQCDNLIGNLSTGMFSPEVAEDINGKISSLKKEIDLLKRTPTPKNFKPTSIYAWLESLKTTPDKEAIHLLIERIDTKTEKKETVFNIQSTLKTVLGENGCGGLIYTLPTIFFCFSFK